MSNIERRAELCPEPGGLQPCPNCGSTAAIVETFADAPTRIRRLCCNGGPFWRSQASRDWFALFGVDVAAAVEARRHG